MRHESTAYTYSIKFILSSLFGCLVLLLASCYPLSNHKGRVADDIDSTLGMSRTEFEKKLVGKSKIQEEREQEEQELEPAIPEISDILAAPIVEEEQYANKLVSISVTENIPVKDVLIEVARLADVDIEIDPGITGGIILSVKDRPFKDVISRICRLGGLRYAYENDIWRVERDFPYLVNYTVDFLNVVRSNNSSIAVDTKILGGAGATASGSQSSISAAYDGDLWSSVETTITSILSFSPSNLSTNDIVSTSTGKDEDNNNGASFTINKQAGIISVVATKRQHDNIAQYLSDVRRTASAQVLIEAKIVEVTLDEQYKSGIDWGTLTNDDWDVQLTGNFKGGISTAADFLTLTRTDSEGGLGSAVSLTESFGVSRTLSSPRLHAMNNQQAVLTFAENKVYFTLAVEKEDDTSGSTTTSTLTVDSTLNSVPIGMILTLQPSINLDTQEVTMNIRPTLSRITGFVDDPGVDIAIAGSSGTPDVKSQVPVVEVRELDSVLKIRSGEIMVIGGLMQEVVSNTDAGVPGFSRLPLLGNFAKSVNKQTDIVETVIFIKATITPSANKIQQVDQDFYRNYTRDPRPLAF